MPGTEKEIYSSSQLYIIIPMNHKSAVSYLAYALKNFDDVLKIAYVKDWHCQFHISKMSRTGCQCAKTRWTLCISLLPRRPLSQNQHYSCPFLGGFKPVNQILWRWRIHSSWQHWRKILVLSWFLVSFRRGERQNLTSFLVGISSVFNFSLFYWLYLWDSQALFMQMSICMKK